jgi:transcriptional regulator
MLFLYLQTMYDIPYFKEQDKKLVLEFMRKHCFAVLVAVDKDSKAVATHIPFFIDESEGKVFLSGHFMKNTDHHLAFMQNENVLVIFNGPQCHVSARLYKNQQTASTWNYMTVHAKGILKLLDNEALIKVLKRTTDHFENDAASPSLFDNLPAAYVDSLSKHIVAFEVEVQALDNVFKLSQNKDEATYQRIIEHLEKQDHESKEIAVEMQKRKKQLFYK